MFAGVRGAVDLRRQWAIAEEAAERHGTQVDRAEHRLVLTMHLAPTREEALADVRQGAALHMTRYSAQVLGRRSTYTGPPEGWVDRQVAAGSCIVGTPNDAVAAIERFQEATGGFGAAMLNAHDWAGREKTLGSFELFARYVAPRFRGSLAPLQAAEERSIAASAETRRIADRAIERLHGAYEERRPETPA